jgi:hypothetical protein
MRRAGHNTKFLVHHTNSFARYVEMGHFRPKPLIRAMSALHPKATAKADMRAVRDAQLLCLQALPCRLLRTLSG